MKRIIPLLLLTFSFCFITAQTEISSFNYTGAGYSTASINDYQSLGINPANLGWTRNDHKMNLGFFEFAGSIFSEALTKNQIQNDLFNSSFVLGNAGKADAADAFTDTKNFATGAVMYAGFSYQDEKIGGFAFNIRDRFVWHNILNESAANFLFLGYNDPYFNTYEFDTIRDQHGEITGFDTIAGRNEKPELASVLYKGTDYHMLLYREFNLGYGRKVIKNDNFGWYLGVNIKYILGQAMARYYQNDNGELIGNSALSPGFGVEYEGEGIYDGDVEKLSGAGMKTVGSGFGFDIGTTIEIKQKLKIALAVNDIGSIKWNKNVYEAVDGGVWRVETAGIDNYNIFEEGELINSDHGPPPHDTSLVGIAEKSLSLPMNFRGGLSYTINEYIEAGLDAYIPLGEKVPGNFEAPVFGLGVRANPANWVQLSIGIVNGGNFGTNMPFGISFFPIKSDKTTLELGFATRDMLTLFQQTNPTVSVAFGFLRFSFGEKEEPTRYLEEE